MTLSTRFYHVIKVWSLHNFYERNYHNLNVIRIWPKNTFFEGWSWFKFNNLGLPLSMALALTPALTLTPVKTKSQKVLWANFYVSRSYRGTTGWGIFLTLPPLIRKRVNSLKNGLITALPCKKMSLVLI